jgi:signal transduction histidine kinase
MHKQRVKREQSTTDAMLTISNALAGKFELDKVLAQIVEVGKKILNAEACVIFLIDPNNPNRLIETKGEGYVKKLEGRAEYTLVPRKSLVDRPTKDSEKVGLTAWIAITGQSFLARTNEELRAHPHWKGSYDTDHYGADSGKKCNSFLGLPLLVGKEILGVLKVENKVEGDSYVPFNEREQQIFEMLANSAAIAITNAREFKRTQDLAAIGMSAAAVAHRMGAPLQLILQTTTNLHTYLISEGIDSPEVANRIADIKEDVGQMGETIQRIRSAAQELHPHIQRHDLLQILYTGAFVNSIPEKYQRRGISIMLLNASQFSNRTINCDKNLLVEALQNIVTNSMEAVSDNEIINVTITENRGKLIIDIIDSGPGMDPSLSIPFEPFRTTKKGGLGLGLFIVRRNIEAMQGTVNYIKQPAGSKFQIELPL